MAGIIDNRRFQKHDCPKCGTPLPVLRLPRSFREWARGGSTCAKCGARCDAKGELRDG